MPSPRVHPKVVLRRASPNFSVRTTPIELIVIHDTESHEYEGPRDLAAIGSLFANRSTDASAHVCTDGDGTSARFVPDHYKSWEVCGYNSYALGIEQIGFASRTTGEWPEAQIKETARWVARWHHLHGVPIRRGIVSAGRVLRSGIVTHSQLGSIGCGHSDPGAGYPMGAMMRHARRFARLL
jgi:N-acetyl-anhydromuramyl-L-alanine amidase AmpD